MGDWKQTLVKNYKNMDLSENELCIIFIVDALLNDGETFITPNIVSLTMSIPFEEVDSCFTDLFKRCYFSYDKNMNLSIDNLKTIISNNYPNDEKQKLNKTTSELIHLFENEFARPLSETEINTINEWIQKGNTIQSIKEALNIAIEARAKSIKYIDKVLLEWQRKEEYRKNGKTTISDKWGKNLEETLEIAKINWIDDND